MRLVDESTEQTLDSGAETEPPTLGTTGCRIRHEFRYDEVGKLVGLIVFMNDTLLGEILATLPKNC